MIEKRKIVYYCEHCKRHGLSGPAMRKHEEHCVRNPQRTCRWGGAHGFNQQLVAVMRGRFHAPPGDGLDTEDIEYLRQEVHGCCPACMLATLLQAGVTFPVEAPGSIRQVWSYSDEIDAYRERERSPIFTGGEW